jgi:hypothetical protein
MALVSTSRYKAALGITDDANDTAITQAIEAASAAIINYAHRDFGSETVTEDRTFTYDGSGILNIDDAADVNSVRWETATTPMVGAAWSAKSEGPPSARAVYTYLVLPEFQRVSGEMGFEYNLDTLMQRGYALNFEADIVVNADWGWPVVPHDVQQATIFETVDLVSAVESSAEGLTAKSVAEVSEAYFAPTGAAAAGGEPLSSRSRRLIDPYKRVV